jgi:hypothetical protein
VASIQRKKSVGWPRFVAGQRWPNCLFQSCDLMGGWGRRIMALSLPRGTRPSVSDAPIPKPVSMGWIWRGSAGQSLRGVRCRQWLRGTDGNPFSNGHPNSPGWGIWCACGDALTSYEELSIEFVPSNPEFFLLASTEGTCEGTCDRSMCRNYRILIFFFCIDLSIARIYYIEVQNFRHLIFSLRLSLLVFPVLAYVVKLTYII